MKILIEHHSIESIPVLEFCNPDAATKLPVVIILPGFTGRKEHNFSLGYQFAQRGYYAVAVDLYLHGEASDGEFSAPQVAPRINEVVLHSAGYIRELVDIYGQHPLADGRRIGLLGISLGGAVIYHYLSQRQAGVRAAVVDIAEAQPFWPVTMRKIMRHFPEFGLTESLLTWLEQDPHPGTFLDGVTDFPLLMQYGVDDPIVPIEQVRVMFCDLQQRYTCQEKVQLVEYPGIGHNTPDAMHTRAHAWFDKYL